MPFIKFKEEETEGEATVIVVKDNGWVEVQYDLDGTRWLYPPQEVEWVRYRR